ncbi:hypothetical protein SAMN05421642_109117 [Rhodococcoides kyotonense]|uniref:Uncharacterized protein n=1 Tax=Rhodococcoides kyotonense TaxID=398843 RepID=A0A239JWR5_9NOCA|nr:hypothetical protein SAMN05421642_109117 [Rhodococcus kyotonensis]
MFGSLAGAGAFSVVVGLSVWLVALFGLLALVEAVDVMSTMTGDWDAARVFETTTSSSQEDS